MDILGVGGWELVAILLIMLIVAGPKRMIAWSYQLGKYVSMLRKMWADTAQMIQKEFDEAGVDVQVPKDIPTRADLNREIGRALTPVTKPFQESMAAAEQEINNAKKAMSLNGPKPITPTTPTEPTPANGNAPAASNESINGNGNGTSGGNFGTWSQNKDQQ